MNRICKITLLTWTVFGLATAARAADEPGVNLTMTFMTLALPEDLSVLSWPVTYLNWDAIAADGKKHMIQIYFDSAFELAINDPKQQVLGANEKIGNLIGLSYGSIEQPILAKKGDDGNDSGLGGTPDSP